MGSGADDTEPAFGSCVRDKSQRLAKIGGRLVDRRTHAGDDLDGRLEQFVLGLGVLTVRVTVAELGEDVGRSGGQLTRVAADELELPFDSEARPRRRRERDIHCARSYGLTSPRS